MTRALPFILTAVIFSSCSRYQYFTVASDTIPTNERKEFVYETDTMRVIYNFRGASGPVGVTIYNKTNQALVVDWKRSALITGVNAVSYYSPDLKINGSIENNPVATRANPLNNITASLDATVAGSDDAGFIPPHASVSRKSVFIAPGNEFPGEKAQENGINTKGNIRSASFTRANSPLVFRSYLTFMAGERSAVFTTDHSFYVTGAFTGGRKPGKRELQPANEFYVKRTSASRTGAVILGSALVIVGVAAID